MKFIILEQKAKVIFMFERSWKLYWIFEKLKVLFNMFYRAIFSNWLIYLQVDDASLLFFDSDL